LARSRKKIVQRIPKTRYPITFRFKSKTEPSSRQSWWLRAGENRSFETPKHEVISEAPRTCDLQDTRQTILYICIYIARMEIARARLCFITRVVILSARIVGMPVIRCRTDGFRSNANEADRSKTSALSRRFLRRILSSRFFNCPSQHRRRCLRQTESLISVLLHVGRRHSPQKPFFVYYSSLLAMSRNCSIVENRTRNWRYSNQAKWNSYRIRPPVSNFFVLFILRIMYWSFRSTNF